MINASDILNSRDKFKPTEREIEIEQEKAITKQKMEALIKLYPIKPALNHILEDWLTTAKNPFFVVKITDRPINHDLDGEADMIWWGTRDGCRKYIYTYMMKKETEEAVISVGFTDCYQYMEVDLKVEKKLNGHE